MRISNILLARGDILSSNTEVHNSEPQKDGYTHDIEPVSAVFFMHHKAANLTSDPCSACNSHLVTVGGSFLDMLAPTRRPDSTLSIRT